MFITAIDKQKFYNQIKKISLGAGNDVEKKAILDYQLKQYRQEIVP